jgi:hypothetical protein
MPRTVVVTRYVTPLREGSSLPALVEADDGREYVVKFRGAGHGVKALVAELLGAQIAHHLGMRVPEIVFAELPKEIAKAEPHQEIRDLLGWSVGLNIGLEFVPGALAPDPTRPPPEGEAWAADLVWLDALVTNPDRTVRNPNLLVEHGRTWLIDHGSVLYIHHSWHEPDAHARRPFERSADHLCLPFAGSITDADARLAPRLDPVTIDRLLGEIPGDWLNDDRFSGPDAERGAYRTYLLGRLETPRTWVAFAESARMEAQRGAVA